MNDLFINYNLKPLPFNDAQSIQTEYPLQSKTYKNIRTNNFCSYAETQTKFVSP